MKKISLLLGTVLLGVLFISFTGTHECEKSGNIAVALFSESNTLFEESLSMQEEIELLDVEKIIYVDEEEEIVLDFNTAYYLPLDFNVYEGMELDLNDITVVEEEKEIDLGFDTAQYLPDGFNAYEGMEFEIDDIAYIELEEEIDLDFDTENYLPLNFSTK